MGRYFPIQNLYVKTLIWSIFVSKLTDGQFLGGGMVKMAAIVLQHTAYYSFRDRSLYGETKTTDTTSREIKLEWIMSTSITFFPECVAKGSRL